MRLLLLERMLQYLPEVRSVGGVGAVPFMQILLMLTSDVDTEEDRDKAILDNFLATIITELDLSGKVDQQKYSCLFDKLLMQRRWLF